MDQRQISPGFVQDALASLERHQVDPLPLLARAGIDPTLPGPVGHIAYGRLWREIAATIGCEMFGEGGRPMRPGSFALMCHAVQHTDKMDAALRRALTFLDVVLDGPLGSLQVQDGQAEIVLADPGGPRSAFAYRTYWLLVLGVMSWLVGRRIALTRVAFSCPAPANRADYHQFFGAPVVFEQSDCRLGFSAGFLRLAPIRSEAELQRFLRGAPANILVRYRHDRGVTGRLRGILQTTAPPDWPAFDTIARELSLSPATLRRRLKAEGQSYRNIRGEILYAEARQLLAGTDVKVADLATALGYAEPGAFHRAFKQWDGHTPDQYRELARRR